MADTKLANLTEDTAPLATDLLYEVKDPAGTPLDRKVKVGNVRKSAATRLFLQANYR
jgi:hypothetical protein